MLDEDEEWRPVVGFPTYEVSSYGRVRTADLQQVKRINPQADSYARVGLRDSVGRTITRAVHRLVAEAFIPGRTPSKRWVDHGDTDKSYNAVDNLEWVTPAENLNRAEAHGSIAPYPRPKKEKRG